MSVIRKLRALNVNPGGSQERQVEFQIASLAAGSDSEFPLAFAGAGPLYIYRAIIVNQVSIGVDGTNFRNFQLRDKGNAGVGVTAASAIIGNGTVALTAHVAYDLVATNGYKLVNGNTLALNCTHGGTGQAITNALVIVVFK